MALIKCTGCGHDVSDKATVCPHCGCPITQENSSVCKECGVQLPKDATVCPNCGCPTDNTEAVKIVYYDEEPPKKKKKWWIWALAAALLFLIGGGAYYFLSEKDTPVAEISTEEKKDSVEVEVKEDIVELTPEFIQAIKKYDVLGEFSGGYAAVLKGEKWGYINTKGEEIITNINASNVGVFSEGLAVVVPTSDGGDGFYVIDTNGKTVFKGKEIGADWDILCIPYFINGLLYVPAYVNGFSYIIYDKQGNKTGTVDSEVGNNLYKNQQAGDYTIFSQSHDGHDDYDYSTEEGMDNKELTFGLKDSSGRVVISANYDIIAGDGSRNISNGVVLVALTEYDEEEDAGEYGHTIFHYGYADLKGNDTFSAELKNRCKQSKITAMQQSKESEYQQSEENNYTYSSNDSYSNSSSSNNELDEYDTQIAEYSPIMEETYQRFLRDVQSGGYTTINPPSSYYELSRACSSVGAAANQARKLCIKNGDTAGEQRYERIWEREKQLYNSAYNIMGNLH